MSYEKKEGQGSLFRNKKKEKDSQPDYKGEILIGGKMYWLAGWIKKSEKAGSWLSLSAELKEGDAEGAAPAAKQDDDDLPF